MVAFSPINAPAHIPADPPPDIPPELNTWYDARRRDPVGDRVHIVLAALHLFLLPLATAPKDITFGLLLFYVLLRLPKTWRGYGTVLRAPVFWAFVAFAAWQALSIAWSSDRPQGLDEIGAARVILMPLMLWLVLDRVALLIGAALCGVLAHNAIQGMQWMQVLGLQPDMESRLDGIIQAIQLGAWCVAAMCWHLSAALHGRGWLRWGSLVALTIAAGGMIATGSRGPWIAGAIALPLALLVIAVRRPPTRRFALVLLAIGLVGAGVAWPVAKRMVVPRVQRAVDELARARAEGDYTTSAGLRVGLWTWAIDVYGTAPIVGAGGGSYQDELSELDEYAAIIERYEDDDFMLDWLTRDHAHSTYLHTLAGQGMVGGALLLALLGLLFVRCARDPPDHLYADGNLFVLIAWIVGAQFDCYHLNGHLYGMLAVIVAVTLAPRPKVGTVLFFPPRET